MKYSKILPNSYNKYAISCHFHPATGSTQYTSIPLPSLFPLPKDQQDGTRYPSSQSYRVDP